MSVLAVVAAMLSSFALGFSLGSTAVLHAWHKADEEYFRR